MKKIIIVLSVFAVMSCSGEKLKKEIKEVNDQLMQAHDEVMPKSMDIPELKKELTEKTANASADIKANVKVWNDSLQKANDDMYAWMEKYGRAMENDKNTVEKLETYKMLNAEIIQIKERTSRAIAKADSILKK